MRELSTVLWDLDGTLVDTGATWRAAEYAFLSSRGLPWDDASSERLVGGNLNRMADIFEEVTGVRFSIDELRTEMSAAVTGQLSELVPYMPGAVELGERFAEHGLRQGIVTSSNRDIAELVATGLPWADDTLLVTLDDVSAPKPDPEPYLLAAQRAGAGASLAIEDSPSGTASALAAGLPVLVVAAIEPSALPAGAAAYAPSLRGLTEDRLRSLLARIDLALPIELSDDRR